MQTHSSIELSEEWVDGIFMIMIIRPLSLLIVGFTG